jgi:3'-phosphoadenosine 5'-phosphosulfate sulfotransferase (PAPS reductase)/FAD synthetase
MIKRHVSEEEQSWVGTLPNETTTTMQHCCKAAKMEPLRRALYIYIYIYEIQSRRAPPLLTK